MARSRRQPWRRSLTGLNISSCCRSKPSKKSERPSPRAAISGCFDRPSQAEVTTFTRDLALLLKAGARLDDALELLASDADVGRLRPVVGRIRAALLSGESLAGAIADHPSLFPAMYVALVRVGEASGTLDQVLEMLGAERARAELMRRKLTDAMQYPAFVLIAAVCVMLFFILFVLPQFSSVLGDFGAKSDSALSIFIRLSEFLSRQWQPS